MRVDVIFTPLEASTARIEGRTVVVIDVFRATSCICAAIENGATRVIPMTTIDESLAMRDMLVSVGNRVLLGGERKMVQIEGFELDNSPRSYMRDEVRGASVVMTTTNGTRSIQLAERFGASEVLIGSLLNGRAAAQMAANGRGDVVLFCSGRQDNFTAEDAICAGYMVGVIESGWECEVSDAAWAVAEIYKKYEGDLRGALRGCEHYNRIISHGLADDVEYCLRRDIFESVPRLVEGAIVAN